MAQQKQKRKQKKTGLGPLGRVEMTVTRGGAGRVCRVQPDGPDNRRVSVADIKTCAAACGSHFFSPGAMRFFRSRVSEQAYADRKGGAFFVTSEMGPDRRRLFSVRHFRGGAKRGTSGACTIDTVGEFQGYKNSAAAHRVARKLAGA